MPLCDGSIVPAPLSTRHVTHVPPACVPLGQVAKTQRELSQSTALGEREKEEMRQQALRGVQQEAEAWADAQKGPIRQKLLDAVQLEVCVPQRSVAPPSCVCTPRRRRGCGLTGCLAAAVVVA